MAALSSVRHNTELNKLFRDKLSFNSKSKALIIIAKKISINYIFIFKYNKHIIQIEYLIQHKSKLVSLTLVRTMSFIEL